MAQNIINVGIVGLGRSGWDIHARTLQGLPEQYRVVAVSDNDAGRRRQAEEELGSRSYTDLSALLADENVELVVIATPSHLHTQQVIETVGRGKHVVCEKPLAMNTADADRMIDAARQAGRVLTVFNNMRYKPDFRKVREVIESGRIGRPIQINITMLRFTRRWDWQTLREFGGGTLFNAGAHLVDLGMQLFGPTEPTVTADVKRTPLTSGDAEDHAKILLSGPGAPTIDIEISNACAYAQDTWRVMGTTGGLRGNADGLAWKWVDFSTMPPRPVDRVPTAAGRQFNREALEWHEATWKKESTDFQDYPLFYEDLYRSLRGGAPLVVTPESVRRALAVLEQCRRVEVR